MIGSPASLSRDDLGLHGESASYWLPPWLNLILAAIGLLVWWYCKQHIINNNKKKVSVKSMPDGFGLSSLMSPKKNRQSFVMVGSILLVAVFLFKAQCFDAAVVEESNTLGLPAPPIGISSEASSNYKDISSSFSPHTVSFLKDKAVSLLFGATVQTYFSSIYTSAVLPWLMVFLVVLPHFGSLLNPSSSLRTNQRGKYGKMKRYGRGLHSKILASLFFLGCIATALDTDDGSEIGMQNEVKTDTSSKIVSLSGSIKRLDKVAKKQLRGNGLESHDTDPTANFLEVADVLESELENIKVVQKQMQSGDGAAVAAAIGDAHIVAQALSNHQERDEDFAALNLFLTEHEAMELQQMAQTATPTELALIAKQFDFTEAIDYFEQAVRLIKDAKAPVVALSSSDVNHQGHRRGVGTDFHFKEESSGSFTEPSRTGSTFKIPNYRSFLSGSSNKNGKRLFTFPKLRYAEKLRKQQETEHGQSRRRLSEDHPTCIERCDAKEDEEERFLCECERLFDCAGKLTPYDYAIMNLGKYIEDDQSAENFANFTVDDMAYIDVFDARDEMLEKMRRVEEGVTGEITRDNCFAVLYELHTACNPNQDEACTEPNTRTFQLSTDQVCDSVNTQTKLKVQPMGEFYDFQNWAVPQGTEYRKVFVTSQTWRGTLGGVSGADDKCQARANAAGLVGTYYAWISDSRSSSSPSRRFDRNEELDSLPYYLVDGKTKVADNWSSLASTLLHPINMDENGRDTGSGRVWTNTNRSGNRRATERSCFDWSNRASIYQGSHGGMAQVDGKWSNSDTTGCHRYSHLYCFQQDLSGSTDMKSEKVHWSTALAVRCCSSENRDDDSDWMRQTSSCPWVLKQENEDECQYLSFHNAENFCAEKGGRLCTKDELERNCANDSGCPFATQLVWSSTEAEPQCPATSIDTCGVFVDAVEKLYEGRPLQFLAEVNPMKEDRDQAINNKHWLRCIRYNQNGCTNPDKVPSLASNDEVHPIACCSDTSNTDPWAKAPSNISPSPPGWCPYRLSLENALIPEADRCKSGTFDEAVEYCGRYGGRLCTSAEFENNCAANSGCQWSQGVNNGEVAWANDFTFSNVDFPVGFSLTFPQRDGVEHGEETLDGYIYADSLSSSGSFCGSSLGPPTALVKACDDSMDFLLGPYMSAGELNSIAEAVSEVNEWVVESVDIGSNVDGSTTYTDETWTLKGSGYIRVSQTSDLGFHYSYVSASSDYIDTKILVQDFTGTEENARVGLMIRESLESNSRHYFTLLNGSERVKGLYRSSTGGSSRWNGQSPDFQGPVWLRTIKNGNSMTSYYKRGSRAVRKVRVTRPNSRNHLHMREVEVIDMNGDNVALRKPAKQSSTLQDRAEWGPQSAVDGNLNNLMQTESERDAYWEVDLESDVEIMEVRIYNRIGSTIEIARISNSVVSLRGSGDEVLAEYNLGPSVSWEQFTIKSEDFSWDIDWVQIGSAISVDVGDKFYVGIAIGARANDLLTATDFTVNGVVVSGADEQPGKINSRWHTWYTRQTDTALIESVNEWINHYQNIANDKNEPSWLDWYTDIRQDNGDRFNLPGYGPFYCEDTSIFEDGESIRNCQELWLNYKTGNPYTSQYMSISYPDNPDLLPFNETSCDEYQTCQEGWVKEGASAQNPFDKNTGCYHFWFYCRELEPETVQCSRFFDDCRDKLEMEYPNWQYPQPPCIDTKIQADVIDTCPMKWLNDTTNPYTVNTNEACFSFWETCRSDLNTTYPEWDYPAQYCENDPDLTCQEDWLDKYKGGEPNPYESDSRCYNFWNSCYENLRLEFPRWSEGWPLADPPTPDDFMPGTCCLDTPANNDHFGYNYDPEQGMKCQKRGPWFSGLSSESCSHANGHWFPTPCITLQRCIDARPLPDDPFFNPQFEEWIESEEVEIYDASDQEQCERTRIALGYEEDYRNDYHICETFDDFMCDPFFDDLEFLADGASSSDPPTEFDQIVFQPTTFPPDARLQFDPLPKGKKMKSMSSSPKDWLLGIKWTKFSLETIKNNYKDFFKVKEETTGVQCDMIFDTLYIASPIGTIGVPNPAELNCRVIQTVEKTIHYTIYMASKIAYIAASTAYYASVIGPYAEIDGYEYSKATYYNVKSSYEWNENALDTMNNNMYEQHHQMRAELQDRHTDVVNHVNEYTSCASNYLGVQFFAAFKNTTVASLSTRCEVVLGIDSNGRRLSTGEKLYNLDVNWGPESIQGVVQDIENKEDDIMVTLDAMMANVNSIMKKLDLDPVKPDPMNDSKSKKSKKAKQAKPEVSEEDLFNRNLLAVEEVVNDKFDEMKNQVKLVEGKVESIDAKVGSMESKVESAESQGKLIESKVGAMEGKIESIEGKVDRMEKTMEEIKDMLSLLMTRGADVA